MIDRRTRDFRDKESFGRGPPRQLAAPPRTSKVEPGAGCWRSKPGASSRLPHGEPFEDRPIAQIRRATGTFAVGRPRPMGLPQSPPHATLHALR